MLHPKLQQKRMGTRRGPTLYERILLFRRLREDKGIGGEQAQIFDNVDGEKAVAYKAESKPEDPPSTAPARSQPRQHAYEETRARTAGIERSDTSFASVDIADYATLEDDPKRSPSPQPTFTKNARSSPAPTTPKTRQSSAKVRPRSMSVSSIENQLHDRVPYLTQLEPGYTVIPEILSTSQSHNQYVYNINRSKSSPDLSYHKSDTNGSARSRVFRSSPSSLNLRQRVRRKRSEPPPNELSLAQKVILQRRVLAYCQSVEDQQIITREIPENATPRQILVEVNDTPRSPRPLIVDNHHTVWADEEDEDQTTTTKEENKTVTVVKEVRHTATPSRHRSVTPVRTPTPKRSPTPSDLNPHALLPPIHKEETHEEKTLVSNEIRQEEVSETINEIENVKTEENKSVENIKEFTDEKSAKATEKEVEKSVSQSNEIRKVEEQKEEISNQIVSEEKSEIRESMEKASKTEMKQETVSACEEKLETVDKTERKEESSNFEETTKEEAKQTNETKDDDKTNIVAAVATAAVAAPAVATGAAVATSKGRSSTPQKKQPESAKQQTPVAERPKSAKPQTPVNEKSKLSTPTKSNQPAQPVRSTGPDMDQKERDDVIEQLDKLADHKIKSLLDPSNAGEEPNIDKNLKEKIFSKQYQEGLDNFLKSP